MFACVCGFEAATEGDLMSHMLDRHRLSYGIEPCSHLESGEGVPSAIQKEDPASFPSVADRA
jgi:hypothetical protein